MIIVKFILAAMLFFLTFLMVTAAERMQPKAGPNYYLDMGPVSANSIQPQYRIAREDAMQRNHALEVECFNNGTPYRVTKLERGRRVSSTVYLIDGYGRLRYVGTEEEGALRLKRLMPQPRD